MQEWDWQQRAGPESGQGVSHCPPHSEAPAPAAASSTAAPHPLSFSGPPPHVPAPARMWPLTATACTICTGCQCKCTRPATSSRGKQIHAVTTLGMLIEDISRGRSCSTLLRIPHCQMSEACACTCEPCRKHFRNPGMKGKIEEDMWLQVVSRPQRCLDCGNGLSGAMNVALRFD